MRGWVMGSSDMVLEALKGCLVQRLCDVLHAVVFARVQFDSVSSLHHLFVGCCGPGGRGRGESVASVHSLAVALM